MKKGWEVKRLGEVCLIKPPKSEVRKQLCNADLVSFVPMENLGINKKYLIPSQVKHLDEVVGSYTYFAENDVLLAKITPCFENGKLGIAQNLFNGVGFGSSEYIVFRTPQSLHNEFLYYFLSREQFREEGAQMMSGAVGHKRVAKDFIENYQIPLPTLPEQRRIVAILDKAFAAIVTAKENAEKNLQNVRELFDSYLQGVFANPGDGWEVKRFENCLEKITYTKKIQRNDFLSTGKFPIISQEQEFINGYWNDSNDLFKVKRPVVIFGDHTLVLKYVEFDFVLGADGVKILQPIRDLNPKYFYYFTRNVKFEKLGYARHYRLLREISILLPPLTEQQSFVAKLDALSAETKKLEAIYRQKLATLDELKKSILQKAFNGDL